MRRLAVMRPLAAVIVLAVPAVARAQESLETRLRDYLVASASLGRLTGAVLVADSGRIVIDTAFGFADLEHRVPNTPETRFRVASVTKQFAAMAIMLLQEDGKLDVRDPIGRYVDSVPDAWNAVTIHHLLRHSSGVSDYEGWFDGYTTQAYSDYMSQEDAPGRIVRDAKARPLDFPPGTKMHYSNTGYILLGYIVERASGMPFEDFLRTRVLGPVGMDRSRMDRSADILPNRARGYALRPGAFQGPYWNGLRPDDLRNAPYQLMDPLQAEAGLVTTARDLYRWDQALYTDLLVPAPVRDSIFSPGLGDYGYGWFIRRGALGLTHQHSGGLPGFSCYIMRIPERRGTIIVLTNLQTMGFTIRDLSAILAGERVAAPRARHVIPTDSTVHAGWVGTYRAAGGDSVVVAWDDLLVARWEGHFTAGMFPESARDFYLALTDGTARFEGAGAGARLVLEDPWGEELFRGSR